MKLVVASGYFDPLHVGHLEYLELASEKDWYYLPLLKLFQQSDLYSKTNIMPNIDSIEHYYNNLINLYIPDKIFF